MPESDRYLKRFGVRIELGGPSFGGDADASPAVRRVSLAKLLRMLACRIETHKKPLVSLDRETVYDMEGKPCGEVTFW